jgi:hypothetical protein
MECWYIAKLPAEVNIFKICFNYNGPESFWNMNADILNMWSLQLKKFYTGMSLLIPSVHSNMLIHDLMYNWWIYGLCKLSIHPSPEYLGEDKLWSI